MGAIALVLSSLTVAALVTQRGQMLIAQPAQHFRLAARPIDRGRSLAFSFVTIKQSCLLPPQDLRSCVRFELLTSKVLQKRDAAALRIRGCQGVSVNATNFQDSLIRAVLRPALVLPGRRAVCQLAPSG